MIFIVGSQRDDTGPGVQGGRMEFMEVSMIMEFTEGYSLITGHRMDGIAWNVHGVCIL
jgi:hypothetical protein